MKLILYLLFPLFFFIHLSAQDNEENKRVKIKEVEEEIWSLENDYISYFADANHNAILDLYHSQFLGWPDSESHPSDKKSAVKFLEENYPEPVRMTAKLKREGIRVSGNIAITHYLVIFSWVDEAGMTQKSESRITHTWIKENSHWKIFGGMSSKRDRE
jgi:ketosteroid isomerase-like protein